jgi:hypothetical protein
MSVINWFSTVLDEMTDLDRWDDIADLRSRLTSADANWRTNPYNCVKFKAIKNWILDTILDNGWVPQSPFLESMMAAIDFEDLRGLYDGWTNCIEYLEDISDIENVSYEQFIALENLYDGDEVGYEEAYKSWKAYKTALQTIKEAFATPGTVCSDSCNCTEETGKPLGLSKEEYKKEFVSLKELVYGPEKE